MKKLIISLSFVLIVNVSFSQTQLWNNFYKDETNVMLYWQQVIEKKITLEGLLEEIKISGNYKEVELLNDKILCKFVPFKADYEKLSYKEMDVPYFITDGLVTGNIIFEVKDGKYRATVKRIISYPNVTNYYINDDVAKALEDEVMNKKHQIKDFKYNMVSNILNQEFQNRVSFKKSDTDAW